MLHSSLNIFIGSTLVGILLDLLNVILEIHLLGIIRDCCFPLLTRNMFCLNHYIARVIHIQSEEKNLAI
ncbi:hypothetical protein Lalb_Chr18g0057231 [Lupinus albus]|uniref:Uncharacterized protein n=1 Tax=Lupinus albus TaxID=3870 RepID=A0A6A4NRE8_LUPAL|nr:hypothetical protein Lalb_Chr18g0057231 [Lupinus albus]